MINLALGFVIGSFFASSYFLRIEDKLNRLINLSKKEAKVNDEKVEDTLKDIIGYTLLMLNYKNKK